MERSNGNCAGRCGARVSAFIALWFLAAFVSAGSAAVFSDPNALLPGEKEQGFVPLFNGKNLDGWVMDRTLANSFSVRNGTIYCDGSGDFFTLLRTAKMYENFELRLEYMTPGWCESGVLFHVPPIGRATRMGFKIQIYHRVGAKKEPTIAGSIFGVLAPPVDMANPSRRWNDLRILMDWPRLQVDLNGKRIHDLDVEKVEALRYRERTGYIALQDIGARVYFRRIRIRTLPSKDKWESLFNGRDFSGWHIADHAHWEVRNGVIHASNGSGYLITDRKFQDFELKAAVRTSYRANGGIFFRWNREKTGDRGYEAQIRNSPDAAHPTGSLYEVERARDDDIVRDYEWFAMHIVAKGPHIIIFVNGKKTAEIFDAKKVWPGSIALQMHRGNAWVDFKDIKIKDLSPKASASGDR